MKMSRNFGTFCTFLNLPHFTHTVPTHPTLFPTPCKESKSVGESGKSRFHFSHMRKHAYFWQFSAFCKENVGECGNVWEMVFEILPHIKKCVISGFFQGFVGSVGCVGAFLVNLKQKRGNIDQIFISGTLHLQHVSFFQCFQNGVKMFHAV